MKTGTPMPETLRPRLDQSLEDLPTVMVEEGRDLWSMDEVYQRARHLWKQMKRVQTQADPDLFLGLQEQHQQHIVAMAEVKGEKGVLEESQRTLQAALEKAQRQVESRVCASEVRQKVDRAVADANRAMEEEGVKSRQQLVGAMQTQLDAACARYDEMDTTHRGKWDLLHAELARRRIEAAELGGKDAASEVAGLLADKHAAKGEALEWRNKCETAERVRGVEERSRQRTEQALEDATARHERERSEWQSEKIDPKQRVQELGVVERDLASLRSVDISDLRQQVSDARLDSELQKAAHQAAKEAASRERTTTLAQATRLADYEVQVQELVSSVADKAGSVRGHEQQLADMEQKLEAANARQADPAVVRTLQRDRSTLPTALMRTVAELAGERTAKEIASAVCRSICEPEPRVQSPPGSVALGWDLSVVAIAADATIGEFVFQQLWLSTCATDQAMAGVELCLARLMSGAAITACDRKDVLSATKAFSRTFTGKYSGGGDHVLAMMRILELAVRVDVSRRDLQPVWRAWKASGLADGLDRVVAKGLSEWLQQQLEDDVVATMPSCILAWASRAAIDAIEEFSEAAGAGGQRVLMAVKDHIVVLDKAAGTVLESSEMDMSLDIDIRLGVENVYFDQARRTGDELVVGIPFAIKQA
ncbi:hypothetical protein LTR53_015065 [Teratosphaeriaceae sp. CCFEE 6253]|nr:hypothetical protein LTR53_015065 [Teratosphaeriaceae sp. CCFEE 6253]